MLIQTDLNSFCFIIGEGGNPRCKRCGSGYVRLDGRYGRFKHRYKCKRCGYRFVWTADLPRRNIHSSIIVLAVDLYTSNVGISLRTIAEKLWQWFKIAVSHETIRQWVLACGKLRLPSPQPEYSPLWHADETYVKVKGKGFWLWLVYCRESHAILAWHLSKSHLLKDALAVLRKAKEAAGMRPQEIITDGLWQYVPAIKKVFGSKYVKHTVDSGIGKNAVIERVNEEVKRRVKWFRTFQSIKCCEIFVGLWVYHWNKRKGLMNHNLIHALKGYAALQTPSG